MNYIKFCLIILFLPALAQGIVIEDKLPNNKEEARAKALFGEIRCAVCSGESIKDSRAELAKDLRKLVRTKISQGNSDQEILDFLVHRYGMEVLMQPPSNEYTTALFIAPIILVILGLLAIGKIVKTR